MRTGKRELAKWELGMPRPNLAREALDRHALERDALNILQPHACTSGVQRVDQQAGLDIAAVAPARVDAVCLEAPEEFSAQRSAEPESLSDETLLLAYRDQGDRASLDALVRRYQHELYSFLRRYLGDDGLAEDAFQLTFLQVHKKAALFDGARRFRPWLYSVATNQAIDLKRREKRRRHRSLDISGTTSDLRETTQASALPDHREVGPDPLIMNEQTESIRAALDELGEPGRSAVELVYLQGLQYRDAALVLDVPVGTVKSRVHTAIRKLADIWKRTVKSVD